MCRLQATRSSGDSAVERVRRVVSSAFSPGCTCLTIKQHAQHFSDTGQKCSCFVSMIRVWASRRGERTKSKSDHRVDGRLRVRLHAMHVSRQLGPFSGGGRRCCARCGINQVPRHARSLGPSFEPRKVSRRWTVGPVLRASRGRPRPGCCHASGRLDPPEPAAGH